MSGDTSPKSGLFYVLWTSKGGNIAFLPHPLRAMLCPCSSYLQKTTNTPTLNGGDRGGVRILLFSEVTLFKYNVSTILSPIVDVGNSIFLNIFVQDRRHVQWLYITFNLLTLVCNIWWVNCHEREREGDGPEVKTALGGSVLTIFV